MSGGAGVFAPSREASCHPVHPIHPVKKSSLCPPFPLFSHRFLRSLGSVAAIEFREASFAVFFAGLAPLREAFFPVLSFLLPPVKTCLFFLRALACLA